MEEPQTEKPEPDIPENAAESKVPTAENKNDTHEVKCHVNKKNRDGKNKKKDDKSVEQVLKNFNSLGSSQEEKFVALCKKYTEIAEENKKLAAQVKLGEKKAVVLQREKEQLQLEHSKTILTRSRLESLCRELQKQNKQIKDESLQRIREEEEKRKTVSNKFQSTLGEITVLMQQNNENNSKLRDENLEMQNKFKTVCEQYELREQQVEKMSKQMQLESQLAEAKLTKLKIEMMSEKELLENEKKQLLIELAAYKHKCQELQKTEATLNSQINMYNEKYDSFQEALAKSNELYCGFKGEIKNMSKKIAKLEKETSIWRSRWENDHKALLQVAAEKLQLSKQLTQLQKLCRTLQGDRTALLSQLKNEGIAPKLSGDQNSVEPTSQEPKEGIEAQTPGKPQTGGVEENDRGETIDGKTACTPLDEQGQSKEEQKKDGQGDASNVLVVEKTEEVSKLNSNSKAKKGKKEDGKVTKN
ncbi:hypothetical protein RUM44_013172 [Polyplax serrata]|uniref:Alpha-taxilin n=1 Tax=Polyplax serrata TaxID=468196 RepID=A0ABR1BDE1_POLSC